jgi:hypothetical protein
MRDWEALVERHLTGLALEPAESAEVIAELAAHLAETCEELRGQGMTEEEAERRALSHVEDWQKLSRLIQTSRTKENIMTNRVKQFWLPSLLTLFLSMGLLMLIQVFGPNPWMVAMKSGWSLIAPVAMVYLPWLFSLPLIGDGGIPLESSWRIAARYALFHRFSRLALLAFFLLALPVTAIFNDRLEHNIMFLALFVGLFAWVLAPGAALLTGGQLARTFLSRRSDARRIVGN